MSSFSRSPSSLSPSVITSADLSRLLRADREQPPSPKLIGRYTLFDEIGAGGMGVVHLGRLTGSGGFERVVAIKRVHPALGSDTKFISMFREEVQLLARVRHQNVVSALDVVEVDGELLLIMEYVHGDSLASLVQTAHAASNPPSVELATTVAFGILQGLHAAHVATSAHGEPLCIVHRDVSPQNLLIGCDGLPRILDFGVAKSVMSRNLTRVGEFRGKPGYVSPEQIRGDKVSPRSDIYALSVVLWEMLAKRRLFGEKSLPKTIEAILEGAVPTLESLSVTTVSPGLEEIVRRGLTRDPNARFASAHEMAAALETEVKLLSTAKVGEWVTGAASATLARRARQLARAETGSTGRTEISPPQAVDAPPGGEVPTTVHHLGARRHDVRTRELPANGFITPSPTSASDSVPSPLVASTAPHAAPAKRRRDGLILAVAAAGITLAAGIALAAAGIALDGARFYGRSPAVPASDPHQGSLKRPALGPGRVEPPATAATTTTGELEVRPPTLLPAAASPSAIGVSRARARGLRNGAVSNNTAPHQPTTKAPANASLKLQRGPHSAQKAPSSPRKVISEDGF